MLYGWGKNAPAMSLPDGVGYSVGPGSAIQGLVLQVITFCLLIAASLHCIAFYAPVNLHLHSSYKHLCSMTHYA